MDFINIEQLETYIASLSIEEATKLATEMVGKIVLLEINNKGTKKDLYEMGECMIIIGALQDRDDL